MLEKIFKTTEIKLDELTTKELAFLIANETNSYMQLLEVEELVRRSKEHRKKKAERNS